MTVRLCGDKNLRKGDGCGSLRGDSAKIKLRITIEMRRTAFWLVMIGALLQPEDIHAFFNILLAMNPMHY